MQKIVYHTKIDIIQNGKIYNLSKSGRYLLIFADNESGRLKNADIVEYNFKEGIDDILRKATSLALRITSRS